jgi:hypothetical protein
MVTDQLSPQTFERVINISLVAFMQSLPIDQIGAAFTANTARPGFLHLRGGLEAMKVLPTIRIGTLNL